MYKKRTIVHTCSTVTTTQQSVTDRTRVMVAVVMLEVEGGGGMKRRMRTRTEHGTAGPPCKKTTTKKPLCRGAVWGIEGSKLEAWMKSHKSEVAIT